MKHNYIRIPALLLFAALLIPGCGSVITAAQAKNGNTVQVNYTGKLTDGTVFDTSAGRAPLEFTLGTGDVVPGFEKAVLGMKVGEKKTVTIPANEAYGLYRGELVVEVSRDKLPSGLTPQVGLQLQQKGANNSVIVATVIRVSETTVTLDANHPFAGKDLTFEIELVKLQ